MCLSSKLLTELWQSAGFLLRLRICSIPRRAARTGLLLVSGDVLAKTAGVSMGRTSQAGDAPLFKLRQGDFLLGNGIIERHQCVWIVANRFILSLKTLRWHRVVHKSVCRKPRAASGSHYNDLLQRLLCRCYTLKSLLQVNPSTWEGCSLETGE